MNVTCRYAFYACSIDTKIYGFIVWYNWNEFCRTCGLCVHWRHFLLT